MRLWGGRFADATDPRAAEFTSSVDIDRALAEDDLRRRYAAILDELRALVAAREALAAPA